jgi:hypothetical protein
MFLAGAAILGVFAGRMAKNLAGDSGSVGTVTPPAGTTTRPSTMDSPTVTGPMASGPVTTGTMGVGPIEMQPADGYSSAAGRS